MKFAYFLAIFAWMLCYYTNGSKLSAVFLLIAGVLITVDSVKEWKEIKDGK